MENNSTNQLQAFETSVKHNKVIEAEFKEGLVLNKNNFWVRKLRVFQVFSFH